MAECKLPGTVLGKFAPVKLDKPIAAFDFDSTLVFHRGRGPDEERASAMLRALAADRNVVIFSNQSGGKERVARITAYLDEHNIACSYLAAIAEDRYRKPHRGMWELYLAHLTSCGYEFTRKQRCLSYYCGDAAGRAATRERTADHSACDAQFARHIGLLFLLPEMLFSGAPTRGLLSSVNVNAKYTADDLKALAAPTEHKELKIAPDGGLLVLMMGAPGSGKTSLAKSLGFTHLQRDELTDAKIAQTARHLLERTPDARIIIDATHGRAAARRKMLRDVLVRRADVRIVLVHVTTSPGLCMHLNAARCELTGAPEIGKIARAAYWKHRELPDVSEGFDEIIEVPFVLRDGAPDEIVKFRYS